MENVGHEFGGRWTEDKLERLRKYLPAYTTIFTKNPKARKLRTIYVDAFAGTGYRATHKPVDESTPTLFEDADAKSFLEGSAVIALRTDPPFDSYLFVDDNPEHIKGLEQLREKFPEKKDKISIIREEANTFLREWCDQTDWRSNRAVVFLDPYGMEVEWKTIQAIAETKAIDLWLLFPLGQAVNRLLTRRQPPPESWSRRLTTFFGTNEWLDAFYRREKQGRLFDEGETLEREASLDAIGRFFVERLETVFTQVAQNPLSLVNSRNVPIFLLCFAAGNPKGAPTAVRIASYILGS